MAEPSLQLTSDEKCKPPGRFMGPQENRRGGLIWKGLVYLGLGWVFIASRCSSLVFMFSSGNVGSHLGLLVCISWCEVDRGEEWMRLKAFSSDHETESGSLRPHLTFVMFSDVG